jgi:hypothetical protein
MPDLSLIRTIPFGIVGAPSIYFDGVQQVNCAVKDKKGTTMTLVVRGLKEELDKLAKGVLREGSVVKVSRGGEEGGGEGGGKEAKCVNCMV